MAAPHYLELSGNAYQRGRVHGGELSQQVTDCVDFYRGVLGLGDRELEQRAAVFEQLITRYAPQQAKEIQGISEGAGLPLSHIYAINARSELVPFDTGECTVVFAPKAGLLGQTWDWCKQLEELLTLLSITLEDGHRLLTLTEPGIVGKLGLSSAGVGVSLNFLSAPRTGDGVPIHCLLREALEAQSLASAQQRIQQAGTGRSGNILLAGASVEGVNFEFAGDLVDERTVEDNFCHTNHFLFSKMPAGELEANSRGRFDRATELLAQGSAPTIGDLKDILSDQSDPDAPICAPYHPLFGLELGTLCTLIMDLPRGELHYRSGSDPVATFSLYRV